MDDVGGAPGAAVENDDLAKIIDHALLHPGLSEEQIAAGCALAREHGVASVTVRPSDVELAAGWMESSGVALGSVVSFPHGNATTSVKLYEARDLIRRGARELDVAINLGKMISRQFAYVEMELVQMVKACHESGAVAKILLPLAHLAGDLRIIAIKIAKRAESDYLAVMGACPPEDLQFLHSRCGDRLKLKAAAETLEQALAARQAGCTRLGTTATAAILEAWKAQKEMDHPRPLPQTPSTT